MRLTVIGAAPHPQSVYVQSRAGKPLATYFPAITRIVRGALPPNVILDGGMSVAEAFSFSSLAVNYHVTEVVDKTQVVTGYVPKSVFTAR